MNRRTRSRREVAELRLTKEMAEGAATKLLRAAGVPEEQARTAAGHLVQADLRGVETHGLIRMRPYIDRIRKGYLETEVEPEVVEDGPAIALVDGHHGLGQVNGDFAMRLAVRKAKEIGVGAVTVRRSSHFGTAASYVMIATEAGCVGVATTNAAPLLAPTGGTERRVGNNPLGIGAPTNEGFPAILDMAMSAVSAWRIRMAAERGEEIPPEWAYDKDGLPTTDAYAAYQGGGLLRPVGDHKGVGLALMMDALSGVLSGGGFGTQIKRLDEEGYLETCHFFLALDITRFISLESFLERMGRLAEEVHGTPTRDGADRPMLPGEREARVETERREHGIPYSPQVYEPLLELASELGVELPELASSARQETG